MKKFRLIENWRAAWRLHSVQVLLLIAGLPAIWVQLPPDVQAYLAGWVPAEWHPLIITVVALAGVILRLRDQSRAGEQGE